MSEKWDENQDYTMFNKLIAIKEEVEKKYPEEGKEEKLLLLIESFMWQSALKLEEIKNLIKENQKPPSVSEFRVASLRKISAARNLIQNCLQEHYITRTGGDGLSNEDIVNYFTEVLGNVYRALE